MKRVAMVVLIGLAVIGAVYAGTRLEEMTNESKNKQLVKENDSNLIAFQKPGDWVELVCSNEKEVLQGLEGVLVVVEDIRPEAEKYGLTRKVIQTDTELLLRQYGIKVLTEEEWLSTIGKPYLYINVHVVMEEEFPMAAVTIEVGLSETVLLLREPKRICVGASTWRRSSTLQGGLDRIKDLREPVKDFVNEFINDYLAANPKEKVTDTKEQSQ